MLVILSAWSDHHEHAWLFVFKKSELVSNYGIVTVQCGCGVQEFPLKSTLDSKVYGDPSSAIKAHHIGGALEGLSVEEVRVAFRNFFLS